MALDEKFNILLRGPDGRLYALKTDVLEQHVVNVDETMLRKGEFEHDLELVQSMAFTVDENLRPHAKAVSCAFADAVVSTFENVKPKDKFVYINLDFRMYGFGNADDE